MGRRTGTIDMARSTYIAVHKRFAEKIRREESYKAARGPESWCAEIKAQTECFVARNVMRQENAAFFAALENDHH